MCGIVGLAYHSGAGIIDDDDRNRIDRTLDLLHHRGPDARGIGQGEDWILGHTRLAIIDPTCANQPFIDPITGIHIVYNGEIFNFAELRNQLRSAGHSFTTQCDTEVVLKSYVEWGEECLNHFNGFFAFGVVDDRKQTIFVARDRLGIKPLFWTKTSDKIAFASTVSALLCATGIEPRLDLPTMSHYLTTGRPIWGNKTLLTDIESLPPGTCRRYEMNGGGVTEQTYWRIPIVTDSEKKDTPFEVAVEECGRLIEDGIRLRLHSDVPLGLFLSGGLDSAIITSATAAQLGHCPPLFCAGSDEEQMNEFTFAEAVSSSVQGTLKKVVITPDEFGTNWLTLVQHKGLPLSTPNEISIFQLSKALKESCSVVLAGEGADEIFGGYVQPHFSAYDYDRSLRSPDAVHSNSKLSSAMVSKYGRAWFLNDADHYLSTCHWISLYDKSRLLQTDSWASLDTDTEVISFYMDFFDSLNGCSTFDKRMHLHARFNLENLLSRVDSSTMAASVEARVPFNDHRIVEYAFQLPDEYKMAWKDDLARQRGKDLTIDRIDELELLETKRLPRNAFKKKVPEEVLHRKKMSFPVPFSNWFQSSLSDQVRAICLESSFSQTYLQREVVTEMLSRNDLGLWPIANLCLWWEGISNSC